MVRRCWPKYIGAINKHVLFSMPYTSLSQISYEENDARSVSCLLIYANTTWTFASRTVSVLKKKSTSIWTVFFEITVLNGQLINSCLSMQSETWKVWAGLQQREKSFGTWTLLQKETKCLNELTHTQTLMRLKFWLKGCLREIEQ